MIMDSHTEDAAALAAAVLDEEAKRQAEQNGVLRQFTHVRPGSCRAWPVFPVRVLRPNQVRAVRF